MTTDNKGSETQTAATEDIKDKISDVADKIAETPAEDKDETWRKEVNSSLAKISAALDKLTATPQGKSPELAALETKLDELSAKLDKTPATPQEPPKEPEPEPEPETPPSRKSGDGNRTPETKTGKSSAQPEQRQVKAHRAKGRGWL